MNSVGTPAAGGLPALAAQLLGPVSVATQAAVMADRLARPVGRTDPRDVLAAEVQRDRAELMVTLARALRHDGRDGDDPQDGYDVGSYRDVADVLAKAVADAGVTTAGRPGTSAASTGSSPSHPGRYSDPRRVAGASLTTALDTVIGSVEELVRELHRLRAAVPTLHAPDTPGGPYTAVALAADVHRFANRAIGGTLSHQVILAAAEFDAIATDTENQR